MSVRSLKRVYRLDVRDAGGRHVGRVGDVLFGPDNRVVGMTVERSRLLMMIDRKDRFLALDRAQFTADGVEATSGKDAWDVAAEKRLGISWDETVIWMGMPARTRGGADLGTVRDGAFDPATGELAGIGLTGGIAADVTLGVRDLPASVVVGFDGDAVVFEDEVAHVETSGGAAAAAGRGVASAKHAGGKAAAQAAEAAVKAAAYGVTAVRSAVKSETGRKTVGFLKSLKQRVDDAINDDDRE